MPAPSTWKTPITSPRPSSSKVAGSSSGMVSRSSATPWRALDQLAGPRHDGQRRQPEEVDLEQAERLEHLHLELGDGADRVVLRPALGRAVERHVVDQRPVGDDHAGGVRAGVARDALQAARRCRSGPSGGRPISYGSLKLGTLLRAPRAASIGLPGCSAPAWRPGRPRAAGCPSPARHRGWPLVRPACRR